MPSKPAQNVHKTLRVIALLTVGFAVGRAYQASVTTPRLKSLRHALRQMSATNIASLKLAEEQRNP